MAETSAQFLFYHEEQQSNFDVRLQNRKTPELVIGFVGPVASGVTTAAEIFGVNLEKEYNYKAYFYKMSSIIQESAHLVGERYAEDSLGSKRIEILQNIGNKLRNKFGSDYIAKKCVEKIANNRLDGGYIDNDPEKLALPCRWVHIIDSIKNPAELELFRKIYGNVFQLVGVFAADGIRRDRLIAKGLSSPEAEKVIERDYHEGLEHGQDVQKTFHDSDLFIRNQQNTTDGIRKTIDRYFGILFGNSIYSPNIHESSMFSAYSASIRSACLSRQVGAAIVSKEGDLIGVGWNDVPRVGGGLYSPEDDGGG